MISYSDLSDEYPNEDRPHLDRDDVDESQLSPDQLAWRRDGIVVKRRFLSDEVIDAYYAFRQKVTADGGWRDPCPYMRHDEIKDIALHPALMDKMQELIGHPMGLHLNLTGWVSTERGFHSDDYLNPAFVHSHYVAVWIALEDISPDSGPFQFVRGSNRWPPLRRHKLFERISEEEALSPAWPSTTERIVVAACESEIERRAAKVETFMGKKGDVLFWHGRLIHRGSKPEVPGTPRRALISHYSSLDHRTDFPERRVYPKTGKTYFIFGQFENPSHDEGVLAREPEPAPVIRQPGPLGRLMARLTS